MQSVPNVLKYEKPRDRNPLGFSKHNDRISIIMRGFIVLHGIRIAKDFVPETFGRLTTVGPRFRLPVGKQGNRKAHQVCQCDCGQIKVIEVSNMKGNKTVSCGCLRLEAAKRRKTKHGLCYTPEYAVWSKMQARCFNKNVPAYPDYGGRGITVCDRWREPNGQGFLNFYSDMGPRPQGAYSIERKHVNGNYCPESCKWATPKEQGRNRRSNRQLTYNGKTQCLAAWAEETDIPANTIYKRLELGWTVQKAVTTRMIRNIVDNA